MAFETAAGLATFDLGSGTIVPSVAPGLYDLVYRDRDRAFLSRIKDGPAVPNTKFSWWERPQRPMSVEATAVAITNVQTSLPLIAGHGARLVIGAVLMDESGVPAENAERISVTDIVGDTLTVTRGYGGTTANSHAASAKFRIVALPAQENSKSGLDLLRHPTEVFNYTQIFRRDLNASRSSQGVQTYPGYHLNAKRLQEKLEELRDELEQTSLFGVDNTTTPAGSDTQLRTTGGLLDFVAADDSTAYTGQTAQDLKAKIDTAVKVIIEAGGDPNFVLAGSTIFGTIMDLDSDKVRFDVNDGVRGAVVNAIRSKFGANLDLVLDRWFPARMLCIGDYRKASMRVFANGGMPHIEQLAKTSDGLQFMIIGELGFQWENAPEAFYLYKDIQVA